MHSPSPILTKPNETPLIDLTPIPQINNEESPKSPRAKLVIIELCQNK